MAEKMSPEMVANVKKTMARMLTTLKQKVDPKHAALIVVDVQNDFCAEGGMFDREGYNVKPVQDMVVRVKKLIEKARAAGVSIVFVKNVYNTENNWYLSDVWLEHCARARGGCYTDYPVCEKDEWNGDFYGLKPQPGDVIVTKHRYNAFHNTDLDTILRAKGIRTLIMTGVATNVCVETTARDGFIRDYYIVFLKDCTATMSQELHNSALKNISLFFGSVVDSEEVINCWEKFKK